MLAVRAGEPVTTIRAHFPERLAGNATGAGDAAVAAMAAGLAARETDLCQLVRSATAWSAAAVLMPLAGEISTRYAEFSERVLVEAVR
jgi:fructose-1-phosphate kinase PfkB-like protein